MQIKYSFEEEIIMLLLYTAHNNITHNQLYDIPENDRNNKMKNHFGEQPTFGICMYHMATAHLLLIGFEYTHQNQSNIFTSTIQYFVEKTTPQAHNHKIIIYKLLFPVAN